jgi:hypothetical protein
MMDRNDIDTYVFLLAKFILSMSEVALVTHMAMLSLLIMLAELSLIQVVERW